MRLLQLLILWGSVLIGVNGQVTDVPTGLDNTESPTETSPFRIDPETTKILVTGDPGFDEERGCFLNTTLVDDAVKYFGSFIQKRVVLCAGTTFDLDFMAQFRPLARTDYFCGNEGISSNNCVVVNGVIHVFIYYLLAGGPSDSVLFQGITFGDVQQGHNLLDNSGDITFRDCKWKDSSFSFHTAVDNASRITFEPELSEDELGRLRVSFYNCHWERNSYIQSEGTIYEALIFVGDVRNDVIIENSTFIGTEYNIDILETGYAIDLGKGGTLKMTNTCFLNNRFKGKGMIFLQDPDENDVFVENNFVGGQDVGVDCDFMYNNRTGECTNADSNRCTQAAANLSSANPPSEDTDETSKDGDATSKNSDENEDTSIAKTVSWSWGFLLFSTLAYFLSLD